jgi:hypothetical protein
VGLLDKLKAVLGRPTFEPPDARKLAASSESELSASLQALPVGEKGWIAFGDARRLFSPAKEDYAFGEMDDAGNRRLDEFAADARHRAIIDFMPAEGRVYFMRR